jgi:type I restriction enzyme S subunit
VSGLPEGWVKTALSDLSDFIMGQAPPGITCNLNGDGTPFVKAGEFGNERPIIREWTTRPLKSALKTDVLICVVGATAGKLNLGADCAIGRSVAAIRPMDGLDQWYLYRFLETRVDELRKGSTGTAQGVISKEMLSRIPLPLPPISEQRRIVAKLDSLFERTRRAREELSQIPCLIENYKKAILEAAFRGDLVKATPYQDWKIRRIEEISKVGTGATPKRGNGKYYDNGTIPWVTSGAVNQQKIESAEEYITQSALDETNCKIFPSGTLLVAMYGEGLTRGKVAILEIDAATNQALAAIQLEKNDLVSNEYLFWFLQSNYLALRALAAGGVQPNLNLGIIKGIQVPIPPLDDQQLIVEKIKSTMDWLKIVDSEQEQAAHLLTYLDQANLAQAFRGELVHQDPNDEPASVLLDRIRGQRAGEARSKRGRRGRTANAQEAMA